MRKRTYTTSHGSDTEIGFDFLAYENRPNKNSLCGFKEAKCAFENGTEEVRRLLLHECNLIYECNICRNMFRNLVNFIGHKRIYCKHITKIVNDNDYADREQTAIIVPETEPKEYSNQNEKNFKSSQANIENGLNNLKPIVKKLLESKKINKTDSAVLKLEKVPTSTKAMYQTLKLAEQDSIKNEINEVHDLLQNVNATVGPDGKAMMNYHENVVMKENELKDQMNTSSFVCEKCNIGFQTEKTLNLHVEKKHLPTTYVFQCPLCTLTFMQPAAVLRHLGNEHKKSAQRIRIMRDNILKKRIQIGKVKQRQESRELKGLKLDDIINNEVKKKNVIKPISTCEFCGKSFERRAAYSSHMFHCRQKHERKLNNTSTKITDVEIKIDETNETKEMLPTDNESIKEKSNLDIELKDDEQMNNADNENANGNGTKIEQDVKKIYCRCKICDKPFNALSNVRRHISMFHYRARKFGCTLCDYRAFRRYDIVNHLIFIHKMENERETMSTQYVAVHDVKYTKEDMNADIVLELNSEENLNDGTNNESTEQIYLPADNDKKNKRKKHFSANEITDVSSEKKIPKLKIKRINQLLPSGGKRPIRNRIKPLNNDFVYEDLAQKQQQQQQSQQRLIKRRNTIYNNGSKPAVRIIHFPSYIGSNLEPIRGATRRLSLKLVNQGLAATSTLPELPLERPKIRPRPASQYPTSVIEANELEAARMSSTLLDEPFLNKINGRSSSDFKIKPCLGTQHTTLDYLLQKVDSSYQRIGTASPKDTNAITEEINDSDYDVGGNENPVSFPNDLLTCNGEQYPATITKITPPPTPRKDVNICVDVVRPQQQSFESLLKTALEN